MKKAFTLIELVVVVAIITIIAGIVVVQTQSAQQIARDNKRKADLASIQSALELYYAKHKSYPLYLNNQATCPSGSIGHYDARLQLDLTYLQTEGGAPSCNPANGDGTRDNVPSPRLAPEFVTGVPTAPTIGARPVLNPDFPISDGYLYSTDDIGSGAFYVLCTKLEDASRIPVENRMDINSKYYNEAVWGETGGNSYPGCNYQVHSPGW